MRGNNLQKKDLFWIGRMLGENVYMETFDEKKAELAERLLQKMITDSDIKSGNIKADNL